MAAVYSYGWCRVEGCKIPDLRKEYGKFVNLSSTTKVFYGTPEIQIFNALNVNGGVVYKVVPIREMLGYESIHEIDSNWAGILNYLNSDACDKNIDISDAPNAANYYYEPFTINESCVIFYDNSDRATTEANTFTKREIILVDEIATPEIIAIVGKYTGTPIPVGEKFSIIDLDIMVVYADGNEAMLRQVFTVDPEDRVIHNVGSNVVNVSYTTPQGKTFTVAVIITGIKNLVSIKAQYDGPNVGIGQKVLKKYITVIAYYSDDSSSTVTDYTFPSGNIVSEVNAGVIPIYYNGLYTSLTVPTYAVTTSRLIAYYNGPAVEIGYKFNPSYCVIKIYYQANTAMDSHYEDIPYDVCEFSPLIIDHEGINYIDVQYTGRLGPVKTKMIVTGITPEPKLNFIEAEYTGPDIVVGKTYSPERIICKAHYSNGSVVTVRNFSLNSNIVTLVGINEFVATFKDKDEEKVAVFTVIGLEKDDTTESTYSPIYLQNHYPEATRLNNRYRGPAESYKHDEIAEMNHENITMLYRLFHDMEVEFNKAVKIIQDNNSIKAKTLNTIDQMNGTINGWLTDERFSSGFVQGGQHE